MPDFQKKLKNKVIVMVEKDLKGMPMGKRSISLPDEMIAEIEKKGVKFSVFVQEAIAEKLAEKSVNQFYDTRLDQLIGGFKSFKKEQEVILKLLTEKETEKLHE